MSLPPLKYCFGFCWERERQCRTFPFRFYTFFTEISISLKVPFVKDVVFQEKIWYTRAMNTPTHAQATEQLETCATHPVGRALRLLGDVWTLLIVYTLLTGTKRFGELLEVMGNVSSKTLSQRLKMLEEIGFVQRQAFLEIPPRVEYRLTEKGLALVDIMEAIKQFGQRYLSEAVPLPPPDTAPVPPTYQ
jgi:DNA-binding HxlR family transcriptional regulator